MMTIDNANELQIKDWKENIKNILMEPLTGKEIVYMLGDAQMSNITYVEDINSMLNNGEIPNLIESQEYQNITKLITILQIYSN